MKAAVAVPAVLVALSMAVAGFSAQNTPPPVPPNPSAASLTPTASAAPEATGKSYAIDVPASTLWLDTKIDLLAGAEIEFQATGSATYPAPDARSKDQTFSPDGLARSWRDLVHQYPVADLGHGALIGRVGAEQEGGQPFAVGQSQKTDIPAPGRLYLGLNQGATEAATAAGSFHVTIAVVREGTGTAGAAFLPEQALPAVTLDLLSKIPRRVSDSAGNPGDMVNVLIVGTDEQLMAAFRAAGWVPVDRSVGDTILAGALATLEKNAYLTMPMSTLFLFGRAQDYGFAHAEPV